MEDMVTDRSVYSLLVTIGQHFLFNCSIIGDGSVVEDASHAT